MYRQKRRCNNIEKINEEYDESEHSREINQKTIKAENYYDNFITVIVGWGSETNEKITRSYLSFEEKYASNYPPDIEKIVAVIVKRATPETKKELLDYIRNETHYVDWKNRNQIRSQIRLGCSRILQKEYSATDSKNLSQQLLDMLLNPTPEFVDQNALN